MILDIKNGFELWIVSTNEIFATFHLCCQFWIFFSEFLFFFFEYFLFFFELLF